MGVEPCTPEHRALPHALSCQTEGRKRRNTSRKISTGFVIYGDLCGAPRLPVTTHSPDFLSSFLAFLHTFYSSVFFLRTFLTHPRRPCAPCHLPPPSLNLQMLFYPCTHSKRGACQPFQWQKVWSRSSEYNTLEAICIHWGIICNIHSSIPLTIKKDWLHDRNQDETSLCLFTPVWLISVDVATVQLPCCDQTTPVIHGDKDVCLSCKHRKLVMIYFKNVLGQSPGGELRCSQFGAEVLMCI